MRQSSASSSMLALQEVADIVFSATRASSDTRLLRSKVGQMIATALQAMTEASCKTLRRRVGQRLRRKLGRILMQEEFEQAVAIYKRYEDDQLNEAEDTAQHENSVTSGEEMSSMSPQMSRDPSAVSSPMAEMSRAASNVASAAAANQRSPLCVAVPVVAVPVLVPVMAAASGLGPPCAEPVEPVSPAMTEVTIPPLMPPHLDVQKESQFPRMCTETTCTGSSVMDDEDFLDQHIDWIRAVSDNAPVERTFIQFNTNLKVTRRSRSR